MSGDQPTTVYQYGPRLHSQGGMAAVLEAYATLPLRRFRFEFVPTWDPRARLWGLGPFVRALVGMPRRRGIAHVHVSVRGSMVREGLLANIASWLGSPVVISLHGGEIGDFARQHPRLVRFAFRRADTVITLGSVTRSVIERHVRADVPVVTVPNPVEVPASPSPAGDQPETVLFAGEVRRLKGVDVLIDAWKQVHRDRPDARLLVAGRAGDFDPTTVDGVEWMGTRERHEIPALLASSRLAVLPSRAEVMPMFILEAMAAARPVVATPVGEIESLVGADGTIVPVGDADALAAAIERLLGDPDEATRLGSMLRARVERDFGPETVAAQLESVYESLPARA